LGRDDLRLVLASLLDTTEYARSIQYFSFGNNDLEMAGEKVTAIGGDDLRLLASIVHC
jgi:hypothetical protein